MKPEVLKSYSLEILWKLIIPELRVLVLTKRHVGSGNEIGFVRLESEHAQSDGKSVNRGLSVLDFPRSRISCCWPKGARPLRTRMQALTRSFKWLFIINLIIPTRSHLYSLILRSFESTKKIEVIINWSNRTPLFKFKFKFYCTLFTENIHKYIKHMRIKKKGGIWHASVKRD